MSALSAGIYIYRQEQGEHLVFLMRSFSLLYAYPVGKKALESKDQRKTNGEGRMLRFMTESIHAGETADASAKERHREQCLFRNPPCVAACPGFVDTEQRKAQYVDCD